MRDDLTRRAWRPALVPLSCAFLMSHFGLQVVEGIDDEMNLVSHGVRVVQAGHGASRCHLRWSVRIRCFHPGPAKGMPPVMPDHDTHTLGREDLRPRTPSQRCSIGGSGYGSRPIRSNSVTGAELRLNGVSVSQRGGETVDGIGTSGEKMRSVKDGLGAPCTLRNDCRCVDSVACRRPTTAILVHGLSDP